ncbi:MAG: hypothetical protein HYT90_02075 [Candidatus Omnitrophica bacterium]|nr:hypothetical protein [Candidatus Omnitrophota bacterium]
MSNQRGTAVLMSLSIVVLLGTLGSTLLMRSLHERQLGSRSAARHQAFFLADGAIDRALLNLRTPDVLTDDITAGTLLSGTFQVDTPAESLGALRWRVTTRGFSQQEERRMEAVVQLTPESVFQYALFGDQVVNVSGNATTDSYDSTLGPYNDDEDSPDYNAGHNGDVGTNGTSAGDVAIGGSIFVDGQVTVGPGADDPESLVTGYDPAFVTGGTDPPSDTQDVVSSDMAMPMPPVVVPSGLTCEDYTVAGNTTVTLPPGTYCYQNLTIQGNGNLTSSGPVTIYVIGELTAQGNSVVGVPNDPSQMLFQMSATAEGTLEQTIQGNNTFYGAIYGPDATFNIQGNATIYGSVMARNVNVSGNADLHYDEALTDETQISGLYGTRLLSWRELAD